MAIGSSQPYFWIRGLVTSDPHRESHRRQLVAAWLFFPCWGTCGIKTRSWDFFDSPVVKTPCFHCRGTGSIPGWGAKIPLTVSEVAQSCPTLCDSMDCSLPGSSVLGIFQARILEWVAISFSRGSSRPRDWTQVPALQADALSSELQGSPSTYYRVWAKK